MASLFKRGCIWYAKWYENGKPRRVSLKTSSVQRARAKLVEMEKALEAGQPIGHRKDVRVEEFTEIYHSHIAITKRPYTVKTLKHEWKRFLAWGKPIRLGDITTARVAEYKTYLLRQGYNTSTVRSSLLALSSVFSSAIKELHLLEGANPVKGVGLPKPGAKKMDYLTLDEIEQLLAAAEQHSEDLHLLAALGIYSGMRKNELINARWGWINFEGQGMITVQSQGRFKTKSGRVRYIPLAARLRKILTAHRSSDADKFIVYSDYPEKEGSDTKYRVDFTEAFSTIAKAAGVPRCTPHLLRHTFASQLAIAGVSLYKIGEWLGHTDTKTTMIYAHLSPQDDDINRF